MSDRTVTASGGRRPVIGRWRLEVTSGPSRGHVRQFSRGTLLVGTAADGDVVLDDRKVSRQHLSIEALPSGLRVRDLGSKNGTYFNRSRIESIQLPHTGAVLRLGESELTLWPDDEGEAAAWPEGRERCQDLIGRSEAARTLFARIERAAATSATVLLHGETGTGKELVARAIHELGARRDRPYVVVDCGAIPRDLIENELFGHVKGAFTGAIATTQGAFAAAHGGTLFLDEVGELAMPLQPKLLRVLERGTFKPVGSDRETRVDVRIIAASLRNLPDEVEAKRFRMDLFYRLSVVRLDVPPLRERRDDIPLLVEHFLHELGARPPTPDSMRRIAGHAWPGNVRQLRNVLERAAALAGNGPLVITDHDLDVPADDLTGKSYKDAKNQVVDAFTRDYLEALLRRHGGNLSAAAREAGVARNWIAALARKHGLKTPRG